jgi:hypothetical protein
MPLRSSHPHPGQSTTGSPRALSVAPIASPQPLPRPAYHPRARSSPSRHGRGRAVAVCCLAAWAHVAGSAQVSSNHSVTTVRSGVDHRSSPALLAVLAESLPSRTPAPTSPVGRLRGETMPPRLRPSNHCPKPRVCTEVNAPPQISCSNSPLARATGQCRPTIRSYMARGG